MASAAMSLRERHNFDVTLGCLVRACIGYETTIDLRDESSVKGIVENVDGFMNVTIKDATFEKVDGTVYNWETLFISANKVRFVHIPDDIDMRATIQSHVRANHRSSKVTGKQKYKGPDTKVKCPAELSKDTTTVKSEKPGS